MTLGGGYVSAKTESTSTVGPTARPGFGFAHPVACVKGEQQPMLYSTHVYRVFLQVALLCACSKVGGNQAMSIV